MTLSLPQGWTVASLAEVLGRPQYGSSVASAVDGAVGVVGMKDMIGGRIDVSSLARMNPPERERATLALRQGDLLLNRTNSRDLVGKLAIWDHPADREALFASYLVRFPERPSVASTRYVLACLEQARAQQQIDRLITTGVSQANINPSAFYEEVDIPLAPLPEQHRIVAALKTWDQAIDQTERLIAAKRRAYVAEREVALAPAFMDMSAGWTRRSLGWAFAERDERDGSLRLASITASDGVVDRDLVERRDTAPDDKSLYKVIRPGDIGYNTMRMWQGVSGLSSLTGIISPAYTVAIPVSTRIDASFAMHLFKLPRMVHRFWRYSQGLVDDTLQLKFAHFAEIEVMFPAIAEQRRIATSLSSGKAEVDLLSRQLALLRTQKRGLTQKLLTGERRLPQAESAPRDA